MKVLVTGANGLLATNIIKKLLEQDYEVVGFLRDKNKFVLEYHQNLQLIVGDITKPETYTKILPEIESIIHVAAITVQNIIDYNVYKHVNVTATKNLYKNAIQHKIKRFVYVSTANCFGFGSLTNLGNETQPIKPPFSKSLYAKSKLEGQNELLKIADNNTELVIVNPTFMIGAYDTKPSSGRLVLSAYKKRIIFYPSGGKSFINVTDAANATIKALTIGKHKEAYVLSGENLSYLQFYKKVTTELNQKSVFVKIPKIILLLVGIFGNILRFFKIKTDISSVNVQTLCVKNYYSNNKAKKHLLLEQNPIENGIKDAIKWFKLK